MEASIEACCQGLQVSCGQATSPNAVSPLVHAESTAFSFLVAASTYAGKAAGPNSNWP